MTILRPTVVAFAFLFAASVFAATHANPVAGAAADAMPLGAGDQIEVTVLRLPEMQALAASLDDTGAIDLPLVGRIDAGGKTPEQVQGAITEALSFFMREPSVRLRVVATSSRPVSVLGAVKQPGVHQLKGDMRLMEVLSLAGGLREDAGYSIKIARMLEQGELPLPNSKIDDSGRFSLAEIDLTSLIGNENPAHNILIRPQDVITAPRARLVYVIGDVNKSGGFVLAERQSMSVLQALALAEGLKGTASPRKARIIRPIDGSSEKDEIAIDVKRILSGRQEDMALYPEDVLFIPNNTAKSAGKVALSALMDVGTGLIIFR